MFSRTGSILTILALVATAVSSPAAPISIKRQGMVKWQGWGNDCDVDFGRACLMKGGDPTLADAGDNFSTGNGCANSEHSFVSDAVKGINDAGETGSCNIVVTTDKECCIDGQCSVWEAGINRRIVKTNSAYDWEQIGSVYFSRACPPGTYIQSEWRLV